jgi:alpha-N-arabinofuranosidase
MPTFGEWEMTVLDHAYDVIDYVSMHEYYKNFEGDVPKFLGRSEDMDAFIKSTVALCDAVKAKRKSKKTVNISFDEWNVWFHSKSEKLTPWQVAPHQLEDVYDFADAILVGCMLMTLQNNCDRVKIACQAQLVNVIAPIMTENGGKAWAQTIFYPYLYASNYGRGNTLRTVVESESYLTNENRQIPYLATSVIDNQERGEVIVFAANRSLEEDMELDLTLEGFDGCKLVEHVQLYHDDLTAINDMDVERVAPTNVPLSEGGEITLKKHSWNMLRFQY